MSNNLLKGKKGIIFGALNEHSIAWKVAERAHEEGAEFILTNAPVAIRMGELDELAKKTNSDVIPADATSIEDLEKLFDAATRKFGKIDFILHSIGMSLNVRKGIHYTENNYEYYMKGMDISAISFHKVMKVAMQKDVMNEWGSVLALSYIAAQRVFPNYNDMSNAKALLESIARNFGYHYGVNKKVRVNTISQSPTATTAGSGVKGFDAFINYAEDMSPLGNASALACADYCISLFSDLTKYVTMQNLFHDGGFSNVGVSQKVMDKFM
ncbi:MAG: SDR family oxidoreductase [Flavobacteriales bacterium]|jgi:enoyl-[acyl-carrier protein] reductase I|nr:SDR family oxidoreductase [Flavobacteriales bacterium]MCW8911778.1 SDR family oxidoreductase [Flavobacteriales bacterium]MCW8937838.1 SDR family oxidoreductase [Flavobacteriales bacterium]MCW8939923.1 SDR family oxidoreductase [Flavobacteriales bacterium]MCW8967683.1 SDR family oxidoreductase [Flavobacteriales bacterium]